MCWPNYCDYIGHSWITFQQRVSKFLVGYDIVCGRNNSHLHAVSEASMSVGMCMRAGQGHGTDGNPALFAATHSAAANAGCGCSS